MFREEIDYKVENIWKIKDHCLFKEKYRGKAHSSCNLRYAIPREVPLTMYNISNNGFYFIIKHLIDKFEEIDFDSLGEHTRKYPILNQTWIK